MKFNTVGIIVENKVGEGPDVGLSSIFVWSLP